MPTNVTEVDNFDANVPVPDDLEDANHAGLLAMVQPLANRTKNLKNRGAGLLATYQYNTASLDFTTTSTSPVDITAYTLSVPNTIVGDILIAHWTLSLYMGGGSQSGEFFADIINGAEIDGLAQLFDATSLNVPPTTLTLIHNVATPGTFTVKGRLQTINGAWTAHARSVFTALIHVQHFRH